MDKVTLLKPVGELARLATIRPNQLAKRLGVAPGVVYAAVNSGKLKAWRLGSSGKAIVIPLDAAEAWLESQSNQN
jgi:excisionase family DNA binding protein